jgi:hypothetical protein
MRLTPGHQVPETELEVVMLMRRIGQYIYERGIDNLSTDFEWTAYLQAHLDIENLLWELDK